MANKEKLNSVETATKTKSKIRKILNKILPLILLAISSQAIAGTNIIVGTKVSSPDTYHMKTTQFLDLNLSQRNVSSSKWNLVFAPTIFKDKDVNDEDRTTVTLNELSAKKMLLKKRAYVEFGRTDTWVFDEMITRDGAQYAQYSKDYKDFIQLDYGRLIDKNQLAEEKLENLLRAKYEGRSITDFAYSVELLDYNSKNGGSLFGQYSFQDKYYFSALHSQYGKDNKAYSLKLGRDNSSIQLKKTLEVIISNQDEDLTYTRLFEAGNDEYLIVNIYELEGLIQFRYMKSMYEDEKYQTDVAMAYREIGPYYKHARHGEDRQDIVGISARLFKTLTLDFGEGRIKSLKRPDYDVFNFAELRLNKTYKKVHLLHLGLNYLDNNDWIKDDIRFNCTYTRRY